MPLRVFCCIVVISVLASDGMYADERAPADRPESATPKSNGTSASYSHLTEAEIAALRFPSDLRRLSLRDCGINDQCLDQICGLKELQFLSLPESRIDEAGLAIGDYDNDGRPDLLITAVDVPPLLLHNESSPNSHWAAVRALNRTGGPAINAVVRLTSAGRTQYREIRSGSTYCSQNSFDAYFGLGTTDEIQKLEIVWGNGTSTTVGPLTGDKLIVIRQEK